MKPKMKEKKLYFFTSNNKISLEEVELSWIKKTTKSFMVLLKLGHLVLHYYNCLSSVKFCLLSLL
jgi:hypothetical protein